MNNKDKCVNSLDKLYQEASFGSLEKAKLIGHYQTVFKRITQPTLDDCIAVVEKMFEKENERLRKIIQAYYSKSWLVTLSKNILAYNIKFQIEIQSALKGLKEGK